MNRVGSGGVACPERGPSDPERRSSRRRWPPAAPSYFTCSSATAQGSSIPVTQEADQRSLTRATSSDDSPADQKARDLALQVGSLLSIFVVRVELFLALAVARLDQLGHERAAYATLPQDAAGDQEAQELALATAALLAGLVVTLVHVVVEL